MKGVGILSAYNANVLSLTGVLARSSGVLSDLRVFHPYSCYEDVDVNVPIGYTGDCFDRYLIRIFEMFNSVSILKKSLEILPLGETRSSGFETPPYKSRIIDDMETLISHYKYFTKGYVVNKGLSYVCVEAPKGELGVFLLSMNTEKPYRVKIRPPGFFSLQALNTISRGGLLSDIVTNVGSIDIVFGEIDR